MRGYMFSVSRIYRGGAPACRLSACDAQAGARGAGREFAKFVASGFMPDGKSRSAPGVADKLRRYGNSFNSKTDFLRVLCVSAVNRFMRGVVAVVLVCIAAWAGIAQAAGSPPGVADRVQELERVLVDWRLGCGGCPTRLGWGDEQLALFVAGRLSSLGFSSELARAGGEWWVLVRLRAEGAEAVVPVLPGLPPLDRDGQFARGVFLGRIPWAEPGRLDPRYLEPEEVLPLPPNAVPEVRLRAHPIEPRPGEAVWFIADVADPDGSVIQFLWDFGDGESSSWWSPEHVYGREGTYTVTLTVVDDRGGVAEARTIVHVTVPPAPPPGGGGGCGCGR